MVKRVALFHVSRRPARTWRGRFALDLCWQRLQSTVVGARASCVHAPERRQVGDSRCRKCANPDLGCRWARGALFCVPCPVLDFPRTWIRGYLKRADQNQDGKMSYEEVKRLLQMINIDLNEQYARTLFKVGGVLGKRGVLPRRSCRGDRRSFARPPV
ncbi:hypothetical protein Z043_109379 [Scleropages formosus]|uniref:EF-hand domain-containing protein n=1 Tax=Scleropages formosus TaxID=113540 RepID=A0A0N8K0B6_SCLFO|nr:hypothetical protein Z043_109379 [Scleropages formosus]